jgi:hypothetical protein
MVIRARSRDRLARQSAPAPLPWPQPIAEPLELTGTPGYQPQTPPAKSTDARVIDVEHRVEALGRQVLSLREDLAAVVELMGKMVGAG